MLAEFIINDNLSSYNKFREFMLREADIVYLRGWN